MHKQSRRALWAACLLGCLLCAAGPALAQGNITVTDLAGRHVTLPAGPQRIICLGPGCLRLIVYLGAQDRVVGIEDLEKRFPRGRPYYLAHPELGDLPTITPGGVVGINNLPDLEGVIKVSPQVVFVTYMQAKKADRLQATLDVPVVVLSYGPFASFDKVVYKSLLLAGRILDKEKRARQVVDFLKSQQKELASRGADVRPRPQAYVGGIGFKGTQGLGSSHGDYVPFKCLGVENLAAGPGKSGHVMLDREKLLALQPRVIFLDGGGLTFAAEDYAKRPRFYESLKAFQQGRVYVLHPFNWYTTNLDTALADSFAIGKILMPERFQDVEPAAKADEIYTFLVGKPVHAKMVASYGTLGGRPTFLKGDAK